MSSSQAPLLPFGVLYQLVIYHEANWSSMLRQFTKPGNYLHMESSLVKLFLVVVLEMNS